VNMVEKVMVKKAIVERAEDVNGYIWMEILI
jgi:hypothetical protein